MRLRPARGVACAVVLAIGLATGAAAATLAGSQGGGRAQRIATVHGLRGAYVPTPGAAVQFVRTDARVNFDWRGTRPRTGFARQGFIVRWDGTITVPSTGRWRLRLAVRGTGVIRLTVGHRELSASPSPQRTVRERGVTLVTATLPAMPLRTGSHYPVEITFHAPSHSGGSVALAWSRGAERFGVTPSSALLPTGSPALTGTTTTGTGTPVIPHPSPTTSSESPAATTVAKVTTTPTNAATVPPVTATAPATTSTPTDTTTTPAVIHPPVGGNIDGNADYSPDFMFVDAMLSAGTFYALDSYGDGPDLSTPATVDANGWPTEDFSFYVNEIAPEPGTYTVQGVDTTAQPDVALHLTQGTVGTMSYDANTGAFSVPVTVDTSNDDPDSTDPFVLVFTDTDGGVQDIHIIRPGYDPTDHPVFTTPFLDETEANDPTVLRAMDLAATNANVVSTWAERTQPDGSQSEQLTATVPWDEGTQTVTEPKGLAWEYIIDLANETHKSIWINVPVEADDEYVTQLAELIQSDLDPDLSVYVEYSNELWNYSFPNEHEEVGLAEQAYADGDTTLAYDGDTNIYTMATRYQAERTVQISNLFKTVWGDQDNRVHTVLASQYANTYFIDQMLQYIAAEYGPPRDYISDIAAAPYVAVPDDANLTESDVLSDLSSAIDTEQASGQTQDWRTEAGAYGLGLVAYEGGFDTSGVNSIDVKGAAMDDPAVEGLVERYLTNWYQDGGGLFNWYTIGTGTQSQYGDWDITDDQTDLSEPRELGIQDIAAGPEIAPTAGTLLPAQIDARFHSGEHGTPYDPQVRYIGEGATFDYLVRAPTDGTYPLSVLTTEPDSSQPGAPIDVSVDGTDAGTLITETPADGIDAAQSSVLALTLSAGLHVIRLTVPESRPFNVDSLLVSDDAAPVTFGSATTPLLPRMDDFDFYQAQTLAPGASWSNTFTVADSATPAGQLAVTASSDNPTVVDDADISVTNDDGAVRFTVTANPGNPGTADVTFTVTDAAGLHRQTEIIFTVAGS